MSIRELKNAPLLEVIAEINWKLDGEIDSFDSHWFEFSRAVTNAMTSILPVRESLVQAGVSIPLNVLERSPILRFRSEPDKWPLMQIGQGILTVNGVPPYAGWKPFIEFLELNLRIIADAYPPFRSFNFTRVQLQYRNAFTQKHGVYNTTEFIREMIFDDCKKRFFLEHLEHLSGQVGYPVNGDSRFLLSYGSATVKPPTALDTESSAFKAALADFITVKLNRADIDTFVPWFSQAHDTLLEQFKLWIPNSTWEKIK